MKVFKVITSLLIVTLFSCNKFKIETGVQPYYGGAKYCVEVIGQDDYWPLWQSCADVKSLDSTRKSNMLKEAKYFIQKCVEADK